MTYCGRVENGVIVLEGPVRLPEGAIVRVEVEPSDSQVGKALDLLAGQAQGLPPTLASRHDHYRRERPQS